MKFKNIILIIIMVAMLLSFGCSKQPTDVSTNGVATFDTEVENEVMLYDYEELSDFQEINATHAFGITKMNTDAQYVKSGTGSMYVRVDGYEEMYHHPEKVLDEKQVIEMYPNVFFETRGDFGDARSFKLDVYNVSDRDIEVMLHLEAANMDIVLDPQIALRNRWTELIFEVDWERSFYWGMDSVKKMRFAFDGRIEGQSPAELYIDNFRYVKSPSRAVGLDYVPKQEGNMLCDFEDKYFILTNMHTRFSYPYASAFEAAKYEWNDDKNYVTSGNYSLKITRPLNSYQHKIYPDYVENSVLSTEYLKQIDLSKYDKDTTVIAVDVYNDFVENVNMRFDVCDGNNQRFAHNEKIKAKEWTTIQIPLTNTFVNWKDIIAFTFTFDDWYGTEECIIYVDNIRLQSVA